LALRPAVRVSLTGYRIGRFSSNKSNRSVSKQRSCCVVVFCCECVRGECSPPPPPAPPPYPLLGVVPAPPPPVPQTGRWCSGPAGRTASGPPSSSSSSPVHTPLPRSRSLHPRHLLGGWGAGRGGSTNDETRGLSTNKLARIRSPSDGAVNRGTKYSTICVCVYSCVARRNGTHRPLNPPPPVPPPPPPARALPRDGPHAERRPGVGPRCAWGGGTVPLGGAPLGMDSWHGFVWSYGVRIEVIRI